MSDMADITGGFKKLKEDLSRMTFKEKVVHLWTYYKSTLVIAVVMILVLSIVVTSLVNVNTDTIVAGVTVNVYLSEEGMQYLGDDYYNKVYDGDGLEEVYITEMSLRDISDAEHSTETYYTLMSLAALISEEELDYMIVDQSALESFIKYESILQDLRDLFTQEELDALGTKVIHQRLEEDGEDIPIAINISDLPFVTENTSMGDKPVYITFAMNSPRYEACRDIYEYILDWKAE